MSGMSFLFDETVIVFLVGSGPGKSDMGGIAPGEEGVVDKLRAVIAGDAEEGEREAGFDVRKGLHNPFLGFIEEWAEFHPARIDVVGDVQGETKLPRISLTAVMDRINFKKPGFRSFQE
jgi:hypothetical protein